MSAARFLQSAIKNRKSAIAEKVSKVRQSHLESEVLIFVNCFFCSFITGLPFASAYKSKTAGSPILCILHYNSPTLLIANCRLPITECFRLPPGFFGFCPKYINIRFIIHEFSSEFPLKSFVVYGRINNV